MTPLQYAAKLRSQLDELERNNRPFKLAVYSTVAKSAERIFSNGENNTGQKFSYSKSYAKFRTDHGRKADFVRYNYIGDLKSDFENTPKGTDSKRAKPETISVNEYQSVTRNENAEKYNHLKEPGRVNKKTGYQRPAYGDFLQINEFEESEFYRILEDELTLHFSK
jgi:hypothetical protein